MGYPTTYLVVILAYCYTALSVGTVVNLGYSQYRGRLVGDGTTQWLGMRYTAPPLGILRFLPPSEPLETKGVLEASNFGPICLSQSPSDWTNKPNTRFTISEDCLYINVFAPSNATKHSKLPVMYFVQGGGFTSNSNANFNGSDLAREGNMVVVSLNYRVGPYGFLWGEEVEEGVGKGNAGIRDVIMGLKWVRDQITKFGGNPSHVVLNGDSAGASALVILIASPAMKNASLFIGAIMESATQIVYYHTLEQAQTGYDCLAKATGCNTTTTASLACLRSVNSTALQTSSCTFNPTIDADLIPITPFHAFAQGDYLAIPTIFGTTADEGTDFAPTYISTPAQFNQFLQAYVPSLSNSSFAVLDKLYITNDTGPVLPGTGALYRNVANVLGDIGFHCAAKIYQDAIVSDGGKTWSYRYAVRDPEDEASGLGAYHTVELNAVWGPNNTDGNPPKSYLPGGINAEIVNEVRPYWINFVKGLDPNAGSGGEVEWETWGNGRRIRFVTNETAMEDLDSGERYRCKVIDPLVRVLEQEPPAGTITDLTL